jgi:hypothetical protein
LLVRDSLDDLAVSGLCLWRKFDPIYIVGFDLVLSVEVWALCSCCVDLGDRLAHCLAGGVLYWVMAYGSVRRVYAAAPWHEDKAAGCRNRNRNRNKLCE